MTELEKRIAEIRKATGEFRIPKNAEKTTIYDFNGTLVETMRNEALDHYERRLTEMLEPLTKLSDEEVSGKLQEKGITIEGKNTSQKLADTVVEVIRKPPRGTKAREAYYDFVELALERGQVNVKTWPDALAQDNTIDAEKRQGLRVVAFSRGTNSLLAKFLKASRLDSKIDKMYSSIEHGGEKKAEAYAGLYKLLLSHNLIPVRFYDDEFEIIREILLFRLALPENVSPFEVVWVDRLNEAGEKRAELDELRKAFEENGKNMGECLQVRKSLLEA